MTSPAANVGQGAIIIAPAGRGNNAQPQIVQLQLFVPAPNSSIAPANPPAEQPSRPERSSCLRVLASCIWNVVKGLFSCIFCCCMPRRPRQGRGRQPVPQNPQPPRGPVLSNRQMVERVLAIPLDGRRDEPEVFFAAFKQLPESIQQNVRTKVDRGYHRDISHVQYGERDDQKGAFRANLPERFASRNDAIDFFIRREHLIAKDQLQKVLEEMPQNAPNVNPAPAAPVVPLAAPVQPVQPPVLPPVLAEQPQQVNPLPAPYPAFLQVDPKIYRDRAKTFLEENVMKMNLFSLFNNLPSEVREIIREAVNRVYAAEIAEIKWRVEFDRQSNKNVFPFKEDKHAIDEFVRTRLPSNEEVSQKLLADLNRSNA